MKFKFLKRKRSFNVKRMTYMSRANIETDRRKSSFLESFYAFADVTKINGLYYLRENTNIDRW